MFNKVQSSIDESNKIMRENILGMRVVKAFCLEKNQQERFKVANTEVKKYNTKAQVLMSLLMPMISMIMQVTIGILLLIGGIGISSGSSFLNTSDIDAGAQLFAIVQVLFMIMSSVIIALMVCINIFRTKPSVDRINQIFDIQPSITNPSQPLHLSDNLDIEFINVNFKYAPEAPECVLKNINCKFKQGQFIGIVGGTGAGKSSLVSLIPRLYDINDGIITIGGIRVSDLDMNELRDQIGIVLQENILFSGTIRSNLKYGNQKAEEPELD